MHPTIGRPHAERLDYLPPIVLLLFWAIAGLAGAVSVARADGDLRHLLLGVVTLPALVLIALALRRVARARGAAGRSAVPDRA